MSDAAKPLTHNQRVLHLLSDGRPHLNHELYALGVIAHSRVSDLRRQGHNILMWREGDDYHYQLVNNPIVEDPDGQMVIAA